MANESPVDRIVAKFGTQQKLADAIGVSQAAVAMWKVRNNIPSRAMAQIINAAAKQDVVIKPEEFFDLPVVGGKKKRGAA